MVAPRSRRRIGGSAVGGERPAVGVVELGAEQAARRARGTRRCRRSTGSGGRPAGRRRRRSRPSRSSTPRSRERGLVGRADERDLRAHHVADRRGRGTGSGCSRAAARRRRPPAPAPAAARRGRSPRRRSSGPARRTRRSPGRRPTGRAATGGAGAPSTARDVGARRRSCRPCRSRRPGRDRVACDERPRRRAR